MDYGTFCTAVLNSVGFFGFPTLSRGEYGFHEYTEVKTVTMKISQKNS